MSYLILVRHGQSTWNLEKKFTGWVDVDLTENGELEAKKSGELIKSKNINIDIYYSSFQLRAKNTLKLIKEILQDTTISKEAWQLNERHYGALTGLNKDEMKLKLILIGISTKNSILIVDYANQIRTTGKDLVSSVKEACSLRFRPIMMTSISTMIAMMPLVIGNIGPGAGEASRLAVGATILGGMIISTFFTLYVTPTMYLALAKNTKRIDSVDLELEKELSKK